MGWIEVFVIVIVALLVIGPDKLPEVARGIAKGVRQVQRLVGEIQDSIRLEEVSASPETSVDPSKKPYDAHPNTSS